MSFSCVFCVVICFSILMTSVFSTEFSGSLFGSTSIVSVKVTVFFVIGGVPFRIFILFLSGLGLRLILKNLTRLELDTAVSVDPLNLFATSGSCSGLSSMGLLDCEPRLDSCDPRFLFPHWHVNFRMSDACESFRLIFESWDPRLELAESFESLILETFVPEHPGGTWKI